MIITILPLRLLLGNMYVTEGNLLKIAPCRFYGPMPNEVGNICIAGHNYNSYKFFSRLKNLSIGDVITIFDLSRKKS